MFGDDLSGYYHDPDDEQRFVDAATGLNWTGYMVVGVIALSWLILQL